MSPYQLFRTGLGILKENSSSLAFGFGIGMSIITVYEAIKAPSNPKKVLDDAEADKQKKGGTEEKLTTLEKGVVLTKTYSRVVVPYALSMLGFGYSKKSDLDALSTFGTMYAFEKQQSKLFEAKAVELLGEKKTEEIKDAVADEQLKQHPLPPLTEEDLVGKSLLYCPICTQYFRLPIATFKEKVVDFNSALMREHYMSFNEWLQYYLELPPCEIIGDDSGWNINANGKMDVEVRWRMVDGMRVGVLEWINPPLPGFMKR